MKVEGAFQKFYPIIPCIDMYSRTMDWLDWVNPSRLIAKPLSSKDQRNEFQITMALPWENLRHEYVVVDS